MIIKTLLIDNFNLKVLFYKISQFPPFLPLTLLSQRLPERRPCHDIFFFFHSWARYAMCFKHIPELLCLVWLQDGVKLYLNCYNTKTFHLAFKGFYCYFIHILCLNTQNYIYTYFSSLQRKLRFLQDKSDQHKWQIYWLERRCWVFLRHRL